MTRTQAMMSCRHWLWAVGCAGKWQGQSEGGRSTRTQRKISRAGAAEEEQQRRSSRAGELEAGGRWRWQAAGEVRGRRCDKRHARARRRHFQLSAFRSRRMHELVPRGWARRSLPRGERGEGGRRPEARRGASKQEASSTHTSAVRSTGYATDPRRTPALLSLVSSSTVQCHQQGGSGRCQILMFSFVGS
jgi:hypothetical protein